MASSVALKLLLPEHGPYVSANNERLSCRIEFSDYYTERSQWVQ